MSGHFDHEHTQDTFKYLDDLSGAAGQLAESMRAFASLNATLTKCMDAWGSPEETDTFDASCNICRHFQREPFDRKTRLVSIEGFPGVCAKTGSPTTGFPRGIFCGKPCYENRRTGARP